MKTVFFAQDKYVSHGFARRVSRFMTCESGATTAEFVIVASFVVALAAGIVTSTRNGATVSANHTASTLEAQAPVFGKLEDGQTSVKAAYNAENASAGSDGSNYDDYKNPPPPAAGGAAPATRETQAPANASGEEAEQQSAEQDADTNAEPEAGTETAEAPEAPEANPKTEQPGEDVAGDDGTNGTEPEEKEEVKVAEVVIAGCENPYNKRGNIKKKCR